MNLRFAIMIIWPYVLSMHQKPKGTLVAAPNEDERSVVGCSVGSSIQKQQEQNQLNKFMSNCVSQKKLVQGRFCPEVLRKRQHLADEDYAPSSALPTHAVSENHPPTAGLHYGHTHTYRSMSVAAKAAYSIDDVHGVTSSQDGQAAAGICTHPPQTGDLRGAGRLGSAAPVIMQESRDAS
jgi:hypothetical protein